MKRRRNASSSATVAVCPTRLQEMRASEHMTASLVITSNETEAACVEQGQLSPDSYNIYLDQIPIPCPMPCILQIAGIIPPPFSEQPTALSGSLSLSLSVPHGCDTIHNSTHFT